MPVRPLTNSSKRVPTWASGPTRRARLNFHTEAMAFEMSALVDLGMTPIQVISAATKTGAEILGKSAELGTVEPGKLADLLIVDGNPLDEIRRSSTSW